MTGSDKNPNMMDENAVVQAVHRFLLGAGYEHVSLCRTTDKGDDIVVRRNEPGGFLLSIEAKGATSARTNSKRFGRPFESSAARVHVSEAVYKAMEVLSRDRSTRYRAGVALPNERGHRRLIDAVRPMLQSSGIAVFWVDSDGDVLVDSPWDVY